MPCLENLWTIVHTDRLSPRKGKPVIPFDCNPGSSDEGMLVYRSKDAAANAARHQRDTYGLACRPRRLTETDLTLD
jgi:hypothetical protein